MNAVSCVAALTDRLAAQRLLVLLRLDDDLRLNRQMHRHRSCICLSLQRIVRVRLGLETLVKFDTFVEHAAKLVVHSSLLLTDPAVLVPEPSHLLGHGAVTDERIFRWSRRNHSRFHITEGFLNAFLFYCLS